MKHLLALGVAGLLSGGCGAAPTPSIDPVVVVTQPDAAAAPADARAVSADAAAAPAAERLAADFDARMATLAGFSSKRIGSIGGGPISPSGDTLFARQLVADASLDQLSTLLRSKNAAVRAHAAREIIHGRPDALALLHLVEKDRAKVIIGSMADTPPIRDSTATIADLVQSELDNTAQSVPTP